MGKRLLQLDKIPDHIIPSLVHSLGAKFEQLSVDLPPHGPRRLADTLKASVRWALRLHDAGRAHSQELTQLNEVYSRLIANLHDTCEELIHPPGSTDFPHELMPAAKEWMCTFAGVDRLQTSIAFLPQWTYNYAILERGSPLNELYETISVYQPISSEIQADFAKESAELKLPQLFYVFRFPEAESRNVLYYPMFLHEFGHAIDWNKEISDKVFESIELKFEGNDEEVSERLEIVEHWVREFVADAIATHLGGPCLVFALWHVSLVVNVLDQDSDTHPSTRTRLALITSQLIRQGFGRKGGLGSILGFIQSQCQGALQGACLPEYKTIRTAVLAPHVRRKILEEVTKAFSSDCFRPHLYRTSIEDATKALHRGRPPIPKESSVVALAIVLNAAWEIALLRSDRPFQDYRAPSARHLASAFRAVSELTLKGIESWYVRYASERPVEQIGD